MASNTTYLQIPPNLDDPIVLRRVLTIIVELIDGLKGNRDTGAAAVNQEDVDNLIAKVDSLLQGLGNLSDIYIRTDGSNSATGPLTYASTFTLTGHNLADVDTVNAKVAVLSSTIASTYLASSVAAATYVAKDTQSAPTLLAGDVDPANISAKVDELINVLKLTDILS